MTAAATEGTAVLEAETAAAITVAITAQAVPLIIIAAAITEAADAQAVTADLIWTQRSIKRLSLPRIIPAKTAEAIIRTIATRTETAATEIMKRSRQEEETWLRPKSR